MDERPRSKIIWREKVVKLRSRNLDLRLAPELGGSIIRLDWLGGAQPVPILRRCEALPADILQTASFPLVPFCNRIRDGRFVFGGRELCVAPNLKGEPSPLHGQGWLRAWAVRHAARDEAELVLDHPPGEWPWRYEARQLFRVTENALELTLSCRNLSHETMPCGLGQHPYLSCGTHTRLDASVTHAWAVDDRLLPMNRVPAEGRYSLSSRTICGQGLDNGFEGWDGLARIVTPGLPMAITLRAWGAGFLHIYSPEEGYSFAAEPMSHRGAALNEPEECWVEAGLRILDPGEEMALRMRIEVEEVG